MKSEKEVIAMKNHTQETQQAVVKQYSCKDPGLIGYEQALHWVLMPSEIIGKKKLNFVKNFNKLRGKEFYVIFDRPGDWVNERWLGRIIYSKTQGKYVLDPEPKVELTEENLTEILAFIKTLN